MQFISPWRWRARRLPSGGAITRDAGPSLPVSHFITVNADKSITYRLFALMPGGLDSDWRHAGLLCLARHDQGSGRSLDMEKRADEAQSL